MNRVMASVLEVRAFPVRSLGADPAAGIDVTPTGVVGDRCFVVLDSDGSALGVDQAPGLRDVTARLEADGVALDVPDADPGLTGPAADAALSAWLERAVRVLPVPQASQLDAPIHLVSVQSLDAARRGEHVATDCACSLSEPRANILLDLAPGIAREEEWPGRSVAVGTAVLDVVRRPGHCLGVYAEVRRPGRVSGGDTVMGLVGSADP